MLGSNSITKSQRKNKNSNSKSQYSKTRKGRKINSSTYSKLLVIFYFILFYFINTK